MKKHNWSALWSVLLFLSLCAQLTAPALAAQAEAGAQIDAAAQSEAVPQAAPVSGAEITISSAEDFLALARDCALDTWSRDKTVVLTGDISLADVAFPSIPSFGGVFDGGGHSISGVNLSGGVSPVGLFGTLQPGAVVKNLRVRGSIAPDGTRDVAGGIAGINGGTLESCSFTGTVSGGNSVGGLAGLNDVTGTIRDSSAEGSITGKSMTGGIAGKNLGVISGCSNRACVNITSVDPSLDLSELDLGAAVSLRSQNALDTVNVATDTGGIAGYSTGMILSCTNLAVIGYQHIGYNVGGIAGRSCGHIAGCENQGAVFGRKDIGGIVGQAEPYIVLSLSADQIDSLRGNLNRLQELVDGALNNAEASGNDLSDRFSAVGSAVDGATDYAEELGRQISRFGEDTVAEVNRAGQILDDAIARLSPISVDLVSLSGLLSQGLEGLQSAVDELAGLESFGTEALQELREASDDLGRANTLLRNRVQSINSGLDMLRNSVEVTDREKYNAAISQINTGLNNLSAAAALTSQALGKLADALDAESPDWEAVTAALRAVADACVPLAQALQTVGNGAVQLRETLNFNDGSFRAGLDEIQYGLNSLASASGQISLAVEHLSSALASASQLSTGLGGAMETLAGAVGILQAGSEVGTGILNAVRDLVNYLNNVSPIQITYPSEEINAAANGLLGAMDQISGEMSALNSQANTLSGNLMGDLRAINGQIQVTVTSLLDALDEAENRTGQDLVSDTSQEDIDAVTSGKILSCVNHAGVRGDINVGGVAGAMAVERELDPEDDLSSSAPIYRREYELKAILQKCSNDGAVLSLRDYAGGICGRADLGLVTRCEGLGTIESESGDYVGGIAGFSGGTVQDSFAKCWLSGGDYVGGITGASADGESGGAVSRCYSLVRITDHGQYAGAISGSGQGSFADNYFVSDTLAGLDQVSLAGKAQAMDYDQLLQVEGLPEAFKSLTLRFLAQTDGEDSDPQVVKELTFHYGDSFGADVFPDIPAVESCYSAWDASDLTDLRFDTDVTAVYTPYITALPGGGRRDDGRPVFLAEGLFSGEDEFTATQAELPGEQTAGLSGTSFLYSRALLETWTLEGDAHRFRYLSPTGNSEDLELYALDSAGWVKLDTGTAGSYLLAQVSGSPATVAVVSRTSIWWLLILTAVLALAVLVLLCVLLVRHRAKRKRRLAAQAAAEQTAAEQPAAVQAAAGQPAVVQTAVEQTAVAQAETAAAQTAVAVAQPAETPAPDSASRARKARRRRRIAALIILPVVLIAAAVVILFATGLKDDLAAYALLRQYMGRDESAARLTVEVQGDSRHYIDAQITRTQVEGKSVTRAETQGAAVYYCDGLVYLENGQAVETGRVIPNFPNLLSGIVTLYQGSDITVFENPSERIYSVSVDGDTALSLLDDLLPSALGGLTQVDLLDVDLVGRDGELAELRIEASGLFAGAEGEAPLTVSATLKALEGDGQAVELPARVRDQILSGGGDAPIADEDIFRLLESWFGLSARDPLISDVSLSADCGWLVLDEELVWSRTHADDVEVNSIQKNGRTYYFSKKNVYDESGNRDNNAGTALFSPGNLLKLAYQLCINGEVSCVENKGTYTYVLALDQDGMARVAGAILPDSEKLALSFQSGAVRITVTEEGVERIRFTCSGSVRLAVVDAPVSMDAELHFHSPSEALEPQIPGDVLTELSRPAG